MTNGTHTMLRPVSDASKTSAPVAEKITLALLSAQAGGPDFSSRQLHGGIGATWGQAPTLSSDHIKFWLEQGDAQAAACWEAAGFEIKISMVLDADCGEENGSPYTINDEEFTMEGLDKCIDFDINVGDIFTSLLSPDSFFKRTSQVLNVPPMRFDDLSGVRSDADEKKLKKKDSGKANFLCWFKEKLGGTEADVIDVTKSLRSQLKKEVAVTLRLCNLDVLNYNDLVTAHEQIAEAIKQGKNVEKFAADLIKTRRPFYGIFEKTQYDQTISRTHFGEYGFSVEFMFSLLGDPEEDLEKPDCSNNNFVACLFKKVAHANKVARKALGAGNKKVAGSGMGAGSLVTGVLDSMLHNTLQFSLTRNRYDTYDVVLDVVSWHTNPMFMSMIRMINGLPSDADIPANLFYLFAYKAKGFKTGTKTNEIQRELKLMFVDVPVESNNELSSSQQQQKAIAAKISLSIAVKILLTVLQESQEHEKEGGDMCKKLATRKALKSSAKATKARTEELKAKDKERKDADDSSKFCGLKLATTCDKDAPLVSRQRKCTGSDEAFKRDNTNLCKEAEEETAKLEEELKTAEAEAAEEMKKYTATVTADDAEHQLRQKRYDASHKCPFRQQAFSKKPCVDCADSKNKDDPKCKAIKDAEAKSTTAAKERDTALLTEEQKEREKIHADLKELNDNHAKAVTENQQKLAEQKQMITATNAKLDQTNANLASKASKSDIDKVKKDSKAAEEALKADMQKNKGWINININTK
jgi:hypothetical protein